MNKTENLIAKLEPGMVVVLGVPFDENSSFMRGPASAPRAIHKTLHSGAGNYCIESGADLQADKRWQELGDLEFSGDSTAFEQIEKTVTAVLDRDARVITLGGDHSVTLPVLRAYARKYSRLNLLQLDAHPDLYNELDGNRYSHATPMLRIMEEKLVARLVQVGIRAATPPQRKRAARFRIETIEMRNWRPGVSLNLNDPLYITLDMDCLDPAFAPGVSHHEPGGLTVRDVLGIIQGLVIVPVGADIVELNPERDLSGVTAALGAKLLKELLGQMLR